MRLRKAISKSNLSGVVSLSAGWVTLDGRFWFERVADRLWNIDPLSADNDQWHADRKLLEATGLYRAPFPTLREAKLHLALALGEE